MQPIVPNVEATYPSRKETAVPRNDIASESTRKDQLTSSPSLRSLGAETYARLRMRSWPGLVICDSTTVSPDRTDFTRASRGMLESDRRDR